MLGVCHSSSHFFTNWILNCKQAKERQVSRSSFGLGFGKSVCITHSTTNYPARGFSKGLQFLRNFTLSRCVQILADTGCVHKCCTSVQEPLRRSQKIRQGFIFFFYKRGRIFSIGIKRKTRCACHMHGVFNSGENRFFCCTGSSWRTGGDGAFANFFPQPFAVFHLTVVFKGKISSVDSAYRHFARGQCARFIRKQNIETAGCFNSYEAAYQDTIFQHTFHIRGQHYRNHHR